MQTAVANVPGGIPAISSRIDASDRAFVKKLFWLGWGIRFAIVTIFTLTDAIYRLRLSPDSEKYHLYGIDIAEAMANGNFSWALWIDNGWYQFHGLVYHLIGPYPLLIQLLNITLSATTAVLVFLIARKIYVNRQTARIAGLLAAVFPSFVYWSCLMLKDPVAIFAIAMIVFALVSLKREFGTRYIAMIAAGILILVGVRLYLAVVVAALCVAAMLPVGGHVRPREVGIAAVTIAAIGVGTKLLGFGYFGMEFVQQSHYFDLDYINHIRVAMGDHGSGAFYESGQEVVTWGESWLSDLKGIFIALFFFFFTLDLTEIGSVRQIMALPEVLVTIWLFPTLVRGTMLTVQRYPYMAWAMLVVAAGVTAVYVAGTTNMGALFRWRMQVMPYMLILVSFGIVYSRKPLIYALLSRYAR